MWIDKAKVVALQDALKGRDRPILANPNPHRVLGTSLVDVPDTAETAYFGMGCFWGAEKLFWNIPGVVSTSVGYQGGHTPNPSYEEVCSGRTGHAEIVKVVYDPAVVPYPELVKVFFEHHDPTQGMRQGNDRGTQYRSAIYTTSDDQAAEADAARRAMQSSLSQAGYGTITTEIAPAGPFYLAEDYHQQYLAWNPGGYDCHVRTGVACPLP